ncbi:MAG: hypothetical protein ACJ8AI_16725 [Rhodopila sp.]
MLLQRKKPLPSGYGSAMSSALRASAAPDSTNLERQGNIVTMIGRPTNRFRHFGGRA